MIKNVFPGSLKTLLILLLGVTILKGNSLYANPDEPTKILRLWYDEPAPDSDEGWADRSIPMGNGYMGVNVFGGTTTERLQITENSLYSSEEGGGFRHGGLNNFAEVYLDFGHNETSNYVRDLNLNTGISRVKYEHDGVEYSREYFTSYPDKVMVIRLTTSEPEKLSFTLRPTIPFLDSAKTGTVIAEGDMIILSGIMHHYNLKYEGQFKVILGGGTMKADKNGTITVSEADNAVILIAVGTNYQVDPRVFLTDEASEKLSDFPDPHLRVSGYLTDAAAKSYAELMANHTDDYTELFDRVSFDLGATEPAIPTDEMVDAYPDDASKRYLEELAFHFGRYMLICSSRAGTLPPHLQGIWNVYKEPPWASQYLHDLNLQMAYSPAFTTNMSELFESYMKYFFAFVHRSRLYATEYIGKYNPSQLDPGGDNGWSGPFWTNPYNVPGESIVAGFGTGAWIAQMFWSYYDFTRDESILGESAYPVMYDQANFVSRFVKDVNGVLLADPSSSPEQKFRNTVGTTFDQQMFYENHYNTLKAARILDRSDGRLPIYKTQLNLLDPILIGKSGHIKEFRQEGEYGEIGDPSHRHTSMLLGLYPGQLINDNTPAWLDAAEVSLRGRTHRSRIGWARAERIAMWARIHDGEEAYSYYRELLGGNFMHNLFNDHRGGMLFQADANYGATAGVAEMLLQSHDYVVAPLTAIPSEWSKGNYRGLLARGKFEVSASWSGGHADRLEVLSNKGGILELMYPNVARGVIKTADGQMVDFVANGRDRVSIRTVKGQTYLFTEIPVFKPVTAPSNLKINSDLVKNQIQLSWTGSPDAISYNLYCAVGNSPEYELVASEITDNNFVYQARDPDKFDQLTLKVTAVRADGRESDKGAKVIRLAPSRFYVSPEGNNSNTGTSENMPFRVVQYAIDRMKTGDTLIILDGFYTGSLKLKSGITLQAKNPRKVIFSGVVPIKTNFEKHKGKIYKTKADQTITQVFYKNEPMIWARWPDMRWEENWDESKKWAYATKGTGPGVLTSNSFHEIADLDLTGAWCFLRYGKGNSCYSRYIEAFDGDTLHWNDDDFYSNTFTGEDGWRGTARALQNLAETHVYHPINSKFFVAGDLDLLDAPGEWFLDNGILYLYTPDGKKPQKDDILIKTIDYCIHNQQTISDVSIDGIDFLGGSVRMPDDENNNIRFINSYFTYPGGELLFIDKVKSRNKDRPVQIAGSNISFENCLFAGARNSALNLTGSDITVQNCVFIENNRNATFAGRPLRLSATGSFKIIRNTFFNNCSDAISININLENYSGTDNPDVSYNNIFNAGKYNSDVSGIYLPTKSQKYTEVHHNWMHNVKGNALRLDVAGKELNVHHNVFWQSKRGMSIEGYEKFNIYNNTDVYNHVASDLIKNILNHTGAKEAGFDSTFSPIEDWNVVNNIVEQFNDGIGPREKALYATLKSKGLVHSERAESDKIHGRNVRPLEGNLTVQNRGTIRGNLIGEQAGIFTNENLSGLNLVPVNEVVREGIQPDEDLHNNGLTSLKSYRGAYDVGDDYWYPGSDWMPYGLEVLTTMAESEKFAKKYYSISIIPEINNSDLPKGLLSVPEE